MSTVEFGEQVETLTEWCIKHQKKSFLKLFDFPLAFLFWPELPSLTPTTEALEEPPQEVFELCDLCGKCYKPENLSLCGLQIGVAKVTEEESQDILGHSVETDASEENCFSGEKSDEETSSKEGQQPKGILSRQGSRKVSPLVNEGATAETLTVKPSQVTFAPNIVLETVVFDPNEYSENKEDERKNSEQKTIKNVKSSTSLGQTSTSNVKADEHGREHSEQRPIKKIKNSNDSGQTDTDTLKVKDNDGEREDSGQKPIKTMKSSSRLGQTDISNAKNDDDDDDDSDDEESKKRKTKCWPVKSKK